MSTDIRACPDLANHSKKHEFLDKIKIPSNISTAPTLNRMTPMHCIGTLAHLWPTEKEVLDHASAIPGWLSLFLYSVPVPFKFQQTRTQCIVIPSLSKVWNTRFLYRNSVINSSLGRDYPSPCLFVPFFVKERSWCLIMGLRDHHTVLKPTLDTQ